MSDHVLAPTWAGDPAQLVDEPRPARIVAAETLLGGRVWDIRRDTVDLGDGQTVVRDLVIHPGAVGVLALDDDDRLFLLRQYRHPVASMLWEPPAGLLDVAGEAPLGCAQRELVEEAGLVARRWDVLLDFETTPGGSSEAIRVYLARELAPAPGGRPEMADEERDLPYAWVPLDVARDLVLRGAVTSPIAVSAILAAWVSRAGGWQSLRPADAPWPARDTLLAEARIYGAR